VLPVTQGCTADQKPGSLGNIAGAQQVDEVLAFQGRAGREAREAKPTGRGPILAAKRTIVPQSREHVTRALNSRKPELVTEQVTGHKQLSIVPGKGQIDSPWMDFFLSLAPSRSYYVNRNLARPESSYVRGRYSDPAAPCPAMVKERSRLDVPRPPGYCS
jgi:hypothetical protein